MRFIIGLVIAAGGGLYLLSALSDFLSGLPEGSGWVAFLLAGLFVLAIMQESSRH